MLPAYEKKITLILLQEECVHCARIYIAGNARLLWQRDLRVHLEELCLSTGKALRLSTPLGAYSVHPEEGGRHQHLGAL